MKSKFDKVIFVTGGYGFIGSAFLRRMVPAHRNWLFINIDAELDGANPRSVESIEGYDNYQHLFIDLTEYNDIYSAVDVYHPSDVFHFAADSDVDKSLKDPIGVVKNNVNSALNLIDSIYNNLKRSDGDYVFNRFVYVSTDEVYGPVSGKEVSVETSEVNPCNPYSSSKLMSESLVRIYGNVFDIDYVITRGCNTYGPWQDITKLIPKAVKSLTMKEKIPVYGSGKQKRQWMHVQNHVSGIVFAWEKGKSGEIYNVSEENVLTNNDLVSSIITYVFPSIKKSRIKDHVVHVKDRLAHDFMYHISNKKLRALGWKPDKQASIEDVVMTYLDA